MSKDYIKLKKFQMNFIITKKVILILTIQYRLFL